MKNPKLKAACSATFLAISVLAIAPGAFAQNTSKQDSQGMGQTSQNTGGSQSRGQSATQSKSHSGTQGENAAGKGQGQSQAQGSSGQKGANGNTALYMIVPIPVIDQSQAMKSGCWVRFYDDQAFKGDKLTMSGPAEMANMVGPFGFNWKNKIRSAETGKKARVLIYDNENFKDLVSTINPGQKISDVSKKMGFFDDFSSMRLVCDGKE